MSRRGENIYFRKDQRWEGRYQKGKTLDGKTKYGSVYGKTYNEVRRKLYPLRVKYQDIRECYGEVAIGMGEWCDTWLNEVKENVEPATFSSYEHKLRTYILPHLENYHLNELTLEIIQELVSRWKRQPLAPSSIRVNIQVLKNCLNKAIRQGFMKQNPCEGVKLPKREPKKQQALSLKKQQRLEKAALSYPKQKGLPIIFALHTGLRIGEVAALKWENVDFENNIIYITHTAQRVRTGNRDMKTKIICRATKTQASTRIIPMGTLVRKWLWEYRKKKSGPFVFSTREGLCEPRLMTYHLHQLCKKAKLGQIHFHQLRHTFATRCVEAKADISSISGLLGHSSTQMTLDVYTHSLLSPKIDAIQLMEAAVS
ncbi:site-specific integrase [Enterococcus hulanensis]|uniref:tyrosine-type recombinase/integrase n=1 Tax=Enterococcus TaxID=1350 RepID=UPI000B5A6083|nr:MULTISPECIES: site-specific integrase [Enterococcus]MBO0413400.1 site-specific integrase [Enterococcus hulanensis]OTO20672.1 hypothetical protein A5875_002025 [Enterococcus sp. 3H8_DIV0648]